MPRVGFSYVMLVGLLCTLAMLGEAREAIQIVLDTPDPGTGKNLVTETTGACAASAHDGSFLHNAGMAAPDQLFATYSFMPPEDGCYLVEEYHPTLSVECMDGRTPGKVPLRIDFCKGKVAKGMFDQSVQGERWNELAMLPFFKGHKGSISITRDGFPKEVCPDDACLYVADAFRLTFVAATCSEADIAKGRGRPHDESEESEEQVPAEKPSVVLNGKTAKANEDSTTATTVSATNPHMSLQIIVVDHVGSGRFVFQPPRDGCYMVEEWHPHVEAMAASPLTVNYCKGKVRQVVVDHTNGRHGQWNYVANLPFFDDHEGSAVMNAQQVLPEHAFRFTHLGARCGVDSAQVHRMELRLTTDFSNVEGRLATFKTELGAALAQHAKVPPQRLTVTHVRAGSIIAEVSVRPAATEVVGSPPATVSARQVLAAIKEGLAGEMLGKELCQVADKNAQSLESCTVSVLSVGTAPALTPISVATKTDGQQVGMMTNGSAGYSADDMWAAVLVGLVVTLVAMVSFSVYLYKKRHHSGDKKADLEATAEAEIVQVGVPPSKTEAEDKASIDDNASTITPTSDRGKEALEEVDLKSIQSQTSFEDV